MFALEITFKGDSPSRETIFIRRPAALIGAQDPAHVIVDEMQAVGYNLLVCRGVGRKFSLTPVAISGGAQPPSFLDGIYEGESTVDVGPLILHFTAIDGDLMLRESEATDRAGVRILRQACTEPTPLYPALMLTSDPPVVISFSAESSVLVGRSRQCSLRLDAPSISSRHARVGYESGEFWIEDLGSTNGTFVNQQQISGRVNVAPGVAISFGREVSALGVVSPEQAAEALSGLKGSGAKPAIRQKRYPVLFSLSESARPARIVLKAGDDCVLGRDPASDMWLGAPHVSRRHCSVEVSKTGVVRVIDRSTNGTAYDGGILHRDEVAESSDKPLVLDFGGNVTVALCFSERDEQAFIAAGGVATSFITALPTEDSARRAQEPRLRSRRTTAWLQSPAQFLAAGEQAQNGSTGGLKQLYTRLSLKGRLVMGAIAVGIIGVLLLLVSMLVLGLRR